MAPGEPGTAENLTVASVEHLALAADPAPGVVIGSFRLERELAGAMTNAIFIGTRVGGSSGEVIVSVGPPQQQRLADLGSQLDYRIDTVAPLVAIADAVSPSSPWSILVEDRPAGVALSELAPVSEAAATELLVAMSRVLVQAHDRGKVLYGIHPRLCYAQTDGTWTGMTPRAMQFLLGMRPARGGLCLDEVYLPIEVWRDRAAAPPSDVFALCALGRFLISGEHPFAGATFDDAVARVARGPSPAPATPLGNLLGRGLASQPSKRPSSVELHAALAAM